MKRYVIAVVILAAAVGMMAMLTSMKKDQRRAPPPPFVRTVLTQTVHYGPVRPAIEATGRVYALERVSLAPEVSGVVEQTGFRLRKGVSFAKGQTLIQIDSREAHYTLQGTISDLRNALTGLLAELKTDIPEAHGRWQTFFGTLSADNLPEIPSTDSEREKLLATRYNVYKLYYAASAQRLALDKHVLVAPFSGTVEETFIYPSSMARAGVAVATVVRTDIVEIELALPEQEAHFVRKAMQALVEVDGAAEQLKGAVDRVSDVLDERMQTVSVFVRVANAAARGLKSGAYATVRLEGSPLDSAFVVARKAIHDNNRVYVIENGKLSEKTLALAYRGVSTAYATGGIDEGAVLIDEPLQDAVIGMAVQSPEEAGRKAEAKAEAEKKVEGKNGKGPG